MPHPRHERLDSTSSSAPLLPVSRLSFSEGSVPHRLEEHDAIWKEYVDAARDFDYKMIDEWNKFLDVTLVFIGLFIAVLTAFIVETKKSFEADPAEVTNKILVRIFNELFNSSSGRQTLDLSHFKITKDELSVATMHNGLLFVSLALSIAISIISMSAKIWLVRYIGWVREPGSQYNRAMKRQEVYTGMQRWKLHRVIDSLPLFTLIAVFFFGLFIHQTIRAHNPKLGYLVGVIFLIGFTFFILASCSAAFIKSAPFQSPFSRLIEFVSQKVLPKGPKLRLICIAVQFTILAVATIPLVAYASTTWQLLIFCPIMGAFAVAEPKPKKSDTYSPLHGPPELVLLGGFTLFIPMAVVLYVDTHRDPGRKIYIVVSSVGVGFLALYGYCMNRLTQKVPDMLDAEAVAWLLESKESTVLCEKASRIANTPQRKALLLGALLPHLPHLIASRVRNVPGEIENRELLQLLSDLENLLNFSNSEWSLLRNEAGIQRPKIPDPLVNQLRELRGNADPRIRAVVENICCRDDKLLEPEKTADNA